MLCGIELMAKKPIADALRHEIEHGGTESPCPFCKVPRCRRSDYIRCHNCLLNWVGNEALDRDPRRERLERFLADARATAPKKREPNG